ncbi:MAG: hypothetical protein QM490_02610 [Candidatus Gracilibacteria bacterium]
MINKFENIEEVNGLFELIKTMLLTQLSQTKIKQLLRDFTHSEIRNGKYENGEFIVSNLITTD